MSSLGGAERAFASPHYTANMCSHKDPVVSVASSSEPLGPSETQALLVGLLAARVAGSAQRVIDGATLDDHDDEILRQAQEMVSQTAAALQFAETSGLAGERPTNFSAIELTIEAAEQIDPLNLQNYLSRLADRLMVLRRDADHTAAHTIREFFSTVSEYASRDVGSVGERPATL